MKIYAEQIFHNGRIYSVDLSFRIFSAMAVAGGRILELAEKEGEDSLIARYYDRGLTHLEDLNGNVVFPGFADTHVHAPGLAFDILFNVNLYPAVSKEETLLLIEDHVRKYPDQEIYYGRGVNSSFFSEEETNIGPRKEHLDKISPERPVIIADFGGNYLWMNTAAFRKYRITPDTPCPAGGEIPIDSENGSLWGIIRGEARALVPYQSFSEEQSYRAATWFQDRMLSYGYTSLTALRPPGTVEPRMTMFSLFKELEKTGELKMRIHGGRDMDPNGDVDEQIEEMKAAKAKYDSDLIRLTTAKFFLDGVVEGLDGCLLEPYGSAAGKDPGYVGVFLWNEEKLAHAFRRCMESGFQIHCHTIGDGAVRKALDAMEKAKETMPAGDFRSIFTHLQLVSADDMKRMQKNGVIANVQTYWHYKSPAMFHQIEKPLLGDRAEHQYPLQSFIREGVLVTASSDYPVTPEPNPFFAIEAGITRNLCRSSGFGANGIKDMDDPEYLLDPHERTTIKDMVKAFTVNAAYSQFLENISGSLESGKAADFIIVDRDPFETDPLDIECIRVTETWFSGRRVYSFI
jgi:predicted amidohydrolase YtcJ